MAKQKNDVIIERDDPGKRYSYTGGPTIFDEAMMSHDGGMKARIAQLEAALLEIRDKAATMPNGGAWAAGLATLSLHTGPLATEHK